MFTVFMNCSMVYCRTSRGAPVGSCLVPQDAVAKAAIKIVMQ